MSNNLHVRENMTAQRVYNRQNYYKILKTIKDANETSEPIYSLKIWKLLPNLGIESMQITTFNKFMREAEEWGMIEAQNDPTSGHRYLAVTQVAEAFMFYCEKNSSKPLCEQTVTERYTIKSGDRDLNKFKDVANQVRGHMITTREAAQTLGVTRKDFLALLKETGSEMHHKYPAKTSQR